jgi:hypothetical protein
MFIEKYEEIITEHKTHKVKMRRRDASNYVENRTTLINDQYKN